MRRPAYCAALIALPGPILSPPMFEIKHRGSATHHLIVGGLLGLGFSSSICGAGGEEPFAKNCAPCHGKDGKAQTPIARKLGVQDPARDTFSAGRGSRRRP